MNKDAKILTYIEKRGKWKELLYDLREIILSTGLEEKVKWGMPVYCYHNKNVVGIGAFKDHAGLWFFQGSLLKDLSGVLVNAQEGKTKGMRHWRFTDVEIKDKKLVRKYVTEAIEVQKSGKTVETTPRKIIIPDELANALESDKILDMHFRKLSAGKQKDYFEYIGGAKKEDTRRKRLEKSIGLILKGKGLNDKYKK